MRLFKTIEVAEALNVCPDNIRKQAQTGALPSIMVGKNRRYRFCDLAVFLGRDVAVEIFGEISKDKITKDGE